MAQNNKGKIFYEITREKPMGKANVLLMGASVGAAISFFIVSVVGAINGIEMDTLVFLFLLSSILGFFIGGFLTWLFVIYFSKVVSGSSTTMDEIKTKMPAEAPMDESIKVDSGSANAPEDEGKGQSVDFVFPELSPDK